MSSSRDRIAQALANYKPDLDNPMAGNPGAYDAQGLESPLGQRLLQNASIAASGYGAGNLGGNIAEVLARKALPQLQAMGEAGAIFPEGMGMPADRTLMKEFGEVLPESRKAFLRNQQLSDWHASNLDWPRVLQDKWALLTHAGGN